MIRFFTPVTYLICDCTGTHTRGNHMVKDNLYLTSDKEDGRGERRLFFLGNDDKWIAVCFLVEHMLFANCLKL